MKLPSYEILRALVFAAAFGVGFWALGQETWTSVVATFFAGVGWLVAAFLYRRFVPS